LHEKTGISFKQIYKLTKDFLKRIKHKEKKISKEVDQESTKLPRNLIAKNYGNTS
jgi:hypothetical protein